MPLPERVRDERYQIMMVRRTLLILTLLAAFFLRTWQLTSAPPGLTHDEANHGREGISILDGDLRLYYPLNYGSEPLYSYLVAGSMAAVGENLFALRLVGAFFGLLTIAMAYRLTSDLFGDWRLGLLTAGFLAVSYWAIVTSRMALRATLLPFFITTAAYCFWRLSRARQTDNNRGYRGFSAFPFFWREPFTSIWRLACCGSFSLFLSSIFLWLIGRLRAESGCRQPEPWL